MPNTIGQVELPREVVSWRFVYFLDNVWNNKIKSCYEDGEGDVLTYLHIIIISFKNMKPDIYYYRTGLAVCVVSLFTTTILLVTVAGLANRASSYKEEGLARSQEFKSKTQVIWAELIEMGRTMRIPRDYGSVNPQEATVTKGQLHKCSQCTRLMCPAGSMGLEGPPGADGEPGIPGKPGFPGFDGEDIELDAQPDLPCTICAGGPPGPRGQQGERGMSGKSGRRGLPGNPGKPGHDGPTGLLGNHGSGGPDGPLGHRGAPGDTVIAGEGIKGPPGPQGSSGPKGPPGVNGRPSNLRGPPGKAGGQGAIGATGKYGPHGEKGMPGPPGEPGTPSTYCPSDCGVNTILTDFGAPSATEPVQMEETEGEPEESFEETSYRQFYGAR
ncbi:unnamed protein product [Auanema sp. JU1783]|nr:unnamed protein product [Auanema sp. JU1783]